MYKSGPLLEAILLSSLSLFWMQCAPSENPSEKLQPEEETYVGRAVCASCHEEELVGWQGSHHDLAMQEATPESVVGDFDNESSIQYGVASTFFERDGSFFVNTEGADGTLQDFEIKYTFGVEPLQQYLIAFPGGRLQALSTAWDSRPEEEGGQRWFHLYPDEQIRADDPLHWTGALQNWNYMCAACHSTNLQKGFSVDQNTYETTWSEIDVSCEACHGPGSKHVTWAEGTRADDSDLGLSVNIRGNAPGTWQLVEAKGSATRVSDTHQSMQVETCAPCHSRRSIMKEPFKAGTSFLDAHRLSLLDESLYHSDGQIQDEVYVYGSFLQSKMYHEGVVCSDCHDPHSLQLKAPGNALCGQCHSPAKFDVRSHHQHEPGSKGAECVECHMPETTYMVVDPRRDHSIRIPRPDLSEKIGVPNACNSCHEDETTRWAAAFTEQWYGTVNRSASHYGEILQAGRDMQPGASSLLEGLIIDKSEPGIARATALSLLQLQPAQSSISAIQAALNDHDPLVRVAALTSLEILQPASRLQLAFPLLRDSSLVVRIEAARVLAPVPQEVLSEAQSQALEEGISQYVEAQLANAERPEAHLNIGLVRSMRQNFADAEIAYNRALSLDSSFVQAYVNMADLLRLQGRDSQGESYLRAAIARDPSFAESHHALGLLLIRKRELAEAVNLLKAAVELAPENARFSYVLGVALNSTDDFEGAMEVLKEAHRTHPNNRDILMALSTMLRDQQDFEQALGYAQKLLALMPGDASAGSLVQQLEELRGR